ncbi:MAG: L-aspartate oxidase [Dehalococcoidia bacterium]
MRHDFIIVGSGIAGLYAALLARERGSVLILTKGSIEECNTRYAQGGIAAAVGPDDTPELHLKDTIEAGAGLVDEEAARILVSEAAERISDLVRFGVPFDSAGGAVALGREGAHSRSRILHAGGDATGAHIELSLSSLARMSGVEIKEFCQVEDVVIEHGRAVAVTTLDTDSNTSETFEARAIVLATGGTGQLYRASTNPDVATGDGVAVAYRAGAEIMDMEFVQFHPTALRMPGVAVFLISEAVRGEGAVLIDEDGRRFMPEYDERAELAPRDIVARAIHSEMTRSGRDRVFLDVTHLPAERVTARFPQIYAYCLEHGLDITKEPIPVSPAAHYMMGGVRTNVWGETTLPGLYACGECACTGVHGANRLASNSLLETVVFARRVVERAAECGEAPGAASLSPDAVALSDGRLAEAGSVSRPDLQSLMWERVGIVRDGESLHGACETMASWDAVAPAPSDRPSHELANLLLCGRLAAEAALRREESRGAHYRTDFPQPRDEWRRHIVFRKHA